jgi:hypothetical protein
VKYLLKSGASPEKLVLGVEFAGWSFTLADRNSHEIGSASNGTGLQGPYTREDGHLGYNEVSSLGCITKNFKYWNFNSLIDLQRNQWKSMGC